MSSWGAARPHFTFVVPMSLFIGYYFSFSLSGLLFQSLYYLPLSYFHPQARCYCCWTSYRIVNFGTNLEYGSIFHAVPGTAYSPVSALSAAARSLQAPQNSVAHAFKISREALMSFL